jgi:hypothetical protein
MAILRKYTTVPTGGGTLIATGINASPKKVMFFCQTQYYAYGDNTHTIVVKNAAGVIKETINLVMPSGTNYIQGFFNTDLSSDCYTYYWTLPSNYSAWGECIAFFNVWESEVSSIVWFNGFTFVSGYNKISFKNHWDVPIEANKVYQYFDLTLLAKNGIANNTVTVKWKKKSNDSLLDNTYSPYKEQIPLVESQFTTGGGNDVTVTLMLLSNYLIYHNHLQMLTYPEVEFYASAAGKGMVELFSYKID